LPIVLAAKGRSVPDNLPALAVLQVTKVFPARMGREALVAVNNVSFKVGRGEILGLLGPNGAGKTTTIKMISGLLAPTSGHIQIGTCDVATDRSKAVRRLGAVLEGNRNLHWKLTVAENLQYFGALKGVDRLHERSEALVEQLDLGDHRKKRVGELSRGLQQRTAIAIALINDPEVLLLDEPTLGLDVVAASTFKDTVRAIAKQGCGIVLTTHQMEVAQALSDRIAIIAKGELAVIESLNQLMDAHRTPGYTITVRGDVTEATKTALATIGAAEFDLDGPTTRFTLPEGHPEALYQALEPLRAAGMELVAIQQQEVNLEGIYRRIVGGAS
jgi:ABC-2 type transport system ATP-binding protein